VPRHPTGLRAHAVAQQPPLFELKHDPDTAGSEQTASGRYRGPALFVLTTPPNLRRRRIELYVSSRTISGTVCATRGVDCNGYLDILANMFFDQPSEFFPSLRARCILSATFDLDQRKGFIRPLIDRGG
jgi:hypothetical protein